MIRELVCITCPLSCHLSVEMATDKIIKVSGNTCFRGENYAIKELTNPTRMLTSTVKIKHALYERLPVITSTDIPKERLFDVMAALKQIEVVAPIKQNDIIISKVCGLEADIIASRSMEEISE